MEELTKATKFLLIFQHIGPASKLLYCLPWSKATLKFSVLACFMLGGSVILHVLR